MAKSRKPDPETTFFHRRHVVSTIWAMVGGLIASVAMLAIQSRQPPQRVEVVNPDTLIRTVTAGDSVSRAYMGAMVEELRRLNARAPDRRVPPDTPDSSGRVIGLPIPAANLPVLNRYALPKSTKGYSHADIGVFARFDCPPSVLHARDDLRLGVRLRNQQAVPRLSPLFVSLKRPETISRSLLVFSQQYELLPINTVIMTAPLEEGIYSLEFGFYVKDEVNTEYPPFYRGECSVRVAQ